MLDEGTRTRRTKLGYWNKAMLDTIDDELSKLSVLLEQMEYATDPLTMTKLQRDMERSLRKIQKARSEITVEEPPKPEPHRIEIFEKLEQEVEKTPSDCN